MAAQTGCPGRWTGSVTGCVIGAGLALLGLPALAYGLSDALLPVLAISALRGVGFAVLTVTGSATVAMLVPPTRLGAAIGLYGLGVALPMLLLLPLSVPLADGSRLLARCSHWGRCRWPASRRSGPSAGRWPGRIPALATGRPAPPRPRGPRLPGHRIDGRAGCSAGSARPWSFCSRSRWPAARS